MTDSDILHHLDLVLFAQGCNLRLTRAFHDRAWYAEANIGGSAVRGYGHTCWIAVEDCYMAACNAKPPAAQPGTWTGVYPVTEG